MTHDYIIHFCEITSNKCNWLEEMLVVGEEAELKDFYLYCLFRILGCG